MRRAAPAERATGAGHPRSPGPVQGRRGAGKAGWGDARLLTKNEWDTPSRPPRPRSARECPHRGRVSHSLGPSPPPRRKGGVSSPPPHQELGAGREAGPAGARPEASAASSRQRGREKERLGRDWGRAERASEGGREPECQRGGEGRPLVSERPRTGVGTLGEEVRRGKQEGRGARAAGGRRRWQGEKEEL